jgi:hypothetical protein
MPAQTIRVENGRWQVLIDRDQDRFQITNKVRNKSFACSVSEADQLARVIDAANSVPDDPREDGE